MPGRPTDYDQEYHIPKLLELMEQGALDCEIMAEFDVYSSTFYRWKREHKEFREAHEKGLPKCEKAAIISPLKKMIQDKDERGLKAVQHLARNKFGHDQPAQSAPSNQININNLNILETKSNVELMEILQQKIATLSRFQDIPKLIDGKSEDPTE